MAAAPSSSSPSKMSCFQCQDSSSNPDHFRNGWRLRSGEFAHLCPRCASAYDDGRFCETFHSSDDGWRDCESCGKLVHCGCIVSFSTHLLLDFGGIICMECSRLNFILARKRCLSLEPEVRARESSGQSPVEAQYWPRVTDSELQKVSRNPKATVTPLFEKILSASDTDLKLARLIIPKRCAENFFPDIPALHGIRIKIQDIDGKDWEFHYRYFLNGGSRIYVLEGLRDYIVSKKWQPGDTVTFYRVEPGGKVVMGLRKTCGIPQLHGINCECVFDTATGKRINLKLQSREVLSLFSLSLQMKSALLSGSGSNSGCCRSIPVSSFKRLPTNCYGGNHDKKQFKNLKRELEIGETVGSISLSKTTRIDLTSALINSFAAAALFATPLANASTMETIVEIPASLYSLADGNAGDWLSGLLFSASQDANVAVQDQLTSFSFTSLAVIFGAGLVTSLSPCTLSVLPLTLGYIGAFGSGKSKTEVIGNSISFAMGLATTLALLGVAASFAGKAYGQIGQGLPVAASSLAIIMGLNLLEVIELQLPSFFDNFDPRAAAASFPSGVQAYLAGLTFALAASPCSTPVLATLLGYVASTRDPLVGGSLLLTYTTGYVAPLLLAASFAGALQSLLSFRKFSAWINPMSGALLLGGGLYTLLDRLFPATMVM